MGEPPPNYGMEERHQLLNHDERLILGVRRSVFYRRSRQVRIAVGILLALGFVSLLKLGSVQPRRLLPSSSYSYPEPHTLATFQTCSINSFLSTGLPFLETASHLPVSEFVERRNNLAKALVADGIDAFTVEPGYTFKYYVNISQPDWEPWEPEERPFLMIIQPSHYYFSGEAEIVAVTRFLLPSFEVNRAHLLGMPFNEKLSIIPWEEHWNPYSTLLNSWLWHGDGSNLEKEKGSEGRKPRVMVDDEMRDFIQRGLSENGFEVVGLGGEVEKVKQVKTEREIGILRAVNTGTVEAIRAVRGCLYLGLSEDEVKEVLDNTLRAGGLEPFFDIVLFGERNASNPHGGTNGSKILERTTFILIDVGAHLYGYSSDITRTFFPPQFLKPVSYPSLAATHPDLMAKVIVFDIVRDAQTSSIKHLRAGQMAASVDIAARNQITEAGYGPFFTHRVGHGIGIKAHESPYLQQGNNETVLRAGMVFTSEPGVYLQSRFGVRIEDVFLVTQGGDPECLSGRRALRPWNP